MIASFQDDWLRTFFIDDVRSRVIPADLENRLFDKLQMIGDAMTDQDLGNHRAVISRGCAVTLLACIRSASTNSSGWSSRGMAARAKPAASISMTTAIDEVPRC